MSVFLGFSCSLGSPSDPIDIGEADLSFSFDPRRAILRVFFLDSTFSIVFFFATTSAFGLGGIPDVVPIGDSADEFFRLPAVITGRRSIENLVEAEGFNDTILVFICVCSVALTLEALLVELRSAFTDSIKIALGPVDWVPLAFFHESIKSKASCVAASLMTVSVTDESLCRCNNILDIGIEAVCLLAEES